MGNGKWEPDPTLVECIGKYLKQKTDAVCYHRRTYKLRIHAGNCGPLPSANGYVLPYTSTLEGSRVMFMCQDDPQSELTAVCTGAGKWEPSPIDVCDTSSKLNNKRN